MSNDMLITDCDVKSLYVDTLGDTVTTRSTVLELI